MQNKNSYKNITYQNYSGKKRDLDNTKPLKKYNQ